MPLFRKRSHLKLSIVVIVYDMPRQALNTLYTLSTNYQRNISESDYEVLVIENRSANNLEQSQVEALPGQFRYFLRDETQPTPVHAINFGASQARAEQLCIMVDGARMVSPQLIHYTLQAQRLYPNPVVSVPGYHLGHQLQQDSVLSGYGEAAEMELLASVNWQEDGYQLFNISCFSGTSKPGFFKPIGESNTLGIRRTTFDQIGGFDPGFTETGGGQCNLDFYKRVIELENTQLIQLFGEGSFHQFHGGITTGKDTGTARDEMMQRHFDQYKSLRGEYYSPPMKDAVYLGELPPPLMKFVHYSAQSVRRSRGELAEPDVEGEAGNNPAK